MPQHRSPPRRGTAFERVYRPLWKESYVRESEQPFVTELIRDADPSDLRQSDVLLRGLTLGRGLPVVEDMCMEPLSMPTAPRIPTQRT